MTGTAAVPTVAETGETDAGIPPRGVLEVDDVVVEFDTDGGRITAVDGVSLHLATGETLGLVGESGCGKSTLARAIMQLVPMQRGSVRLEDTDLGSLPAGSCAACATASRWCSRTLAVPSIPA